MPRSWSQYSRQDWLHIRPIVERYKHGRYQLLMHYHLRRQLHGPDVLRPLIQALTGQRVLTTIAFNDPEVIEWQIRLVRRHVPNCVHLIADNSTSPAASEAIKTTAAAHGCPYINPPRGPWHKVEHGGRSHGLAMTWVWRYLLRPARPIVFGYLDHDIFPLRPSDPFQLVADYPVGGAVQRNLGRWNLWAGFCFFRYEAVRDIRLNFSTDWASGLDTGGGNWPRLYRQLDVEKVADPGYALEPVAADIPVDVLAFERRGDWLHETNFLLRLDMDPALRVTLRARKREVMRRHVTAALGEER